MALVDIPCLSFHTKWSVPERVPSLVGRGSQINTSPCVFAVDDPGPSSGESRVMLLLNHAHRLRPSVLMVGPQTDAFYCKTGLATKVQFTPLNPYHKKMFLDKVMYKCMGINGGASFIRRSCSSL